MIMAAGLPAFGFAFPAAFPEFPDQAEICGFPVFHFGALFRCRGAFAGGKMGDPDGGIRFVEMLSDVSGGPPGFHAEVTPAEEPFSGIKPDFRNSGGPVFARMMRPERTGLNPQHRSDPALGKAFRRFFPDPEQDGGVPSLSGSSG